VSQPRGVQRFDGASFSWIGGSNFTDNPLVRVERRVGRRWAPFADQSGEIPVTLKYPQPTDVAAFLLGGQKWRWTASFEAFVSRYDLLAGSRATPAGTYRFVVDGAHRTGHRAVPYRIVSRSFAVAPWRGITVNDFRAGRGGSVSYAVGPSTRMPASETGHPTLTAAIGPIDYPDSYASPVRFVKRKRSFIRDPAAPNDPRKLEWYCNACSFRPWLDAGDASSGIVTVLSPDGSTRRVRAVRRGGRWVARAALRCRGEIAFVSAGGVRDPWGDLNGRRSAVVRAAGAPCRFARRGPSLTG